MFSHKIGTHFPGNSEEAKRHGGEENPELNFLHNDKTGMEYELWEDADGDLVLGASHEDVGLVIWYYIDREYWDMLEQSASDSIQE